MPKIEIGHKSSLIISIIKIQKKEKRLSPILWWCEIGEACTSQAPTYADNKVVSIELLNGGHNMWSLWGLAKNWKRRSLAEYRKNFQFDLHCNSSMWLGPTGWKLRHWKIRMKV